MKQFAIIFIFILISSCKAKKEYVYKTSIDTIKVTKIVKITPQQLNNIVIDNPCDSLGNLKHFTYTFGTDKNKTVLKAKNNTIYLTQNLDSIKEVLEKEYKTSNKTSNIKIEVPVTPKWAYYSALINLLFALWIFKKPLSKLFI